MALKEHIEKLFAAQNQFFESKVENIEKNTGLAASSMEKRLDGMNEFRETLRDQAGKFFTRTEQDVYRDSVERELRTLTEFRVAIEAVAATKASQSAFNVAMATALIALLIGVIEVALRFLKP